jgi:hypothetical protein
MQSSMYVDKRRTTAPFGASWGRKRVKRKKYILTENEKNQCRSFPSFFLFHVFSFKSRMESVKNFPLHANY